MDAESGGERTIPQRPEAGEQTTKARYAERYRRDRGAEGNVSALMKEIGRLLGWGM